MNNVLKDIEELKQDIINSKEYKEYKKYNDILENNKEIKSIIKDIVSKQKELVSKLNNDKDLEKELDNLYERLNSYEDYNKYIEASQNLNILISEVQNTFEKYFNSLIS